MTCTSCGVAPPAEARFCAACGAPLTAARAVEERKLVTVVFCDLVGSTAMSEALDPETLRSVVLRYFAAMRDQIELFGGTVEKFIGDAVMAVFGVPVMHEDDAHRAAMAALGMLDALDVLNEDLAVSPGVRLRVRIGINTGPAVASTDVSRRQALVSGDTVNVAARLEQHAAEGQILIGPLTHRAVAAVADVEAAGPLSLKGKAAPVTAYRLLAMGPDSPELSRRFDVPFVGRAGELGALQEAFNAVADAGPARLLTVCGEPGIGKTRLLRAWRERLGPSARHGAGRCQAYGERGSLAPLADAVEDLLTGAGLRRIDPGALAVLRAGLLLDGTPGPSLEGTCLALVRLLGHLSRTAPHETVARHEPVVLVVDDCQWADDPLLDTLERLASLASRTDRTALLLVCAGRPDLLERRPGWGGSPVGYLHLGPLSTAECERMAATRAEVSAHISADLAPMIEAAGGNPFHLEQLIEAIGDGNPAGALPQSLQSLIGARIDALGSAERTALELAAVLGRDFRSADVAALAGTGAESAADGPLPSGPAGDPVPAALTRLARRRLIEPAATRGGGEPRLRFISVLIHEVVYQAMAKRTRADRHERAADLLTRHRPAGLAVAGHLERAFRYRVELARPDADAEALRRRAAVLLAAAGARALARSDLSWAATLLRRSVDLSDPSEQSWPTATRQLGEVQLATGHLAEGRALLNRVLGTITDPVELAHARLDLVLTDPDGPVGPAAATARETLPVFEKAEDPLGQARARIRLAQELQFDGRHAAADALLTIALEQAERCTAEPERALALGAIGMSLWRGPTPVPAAVARCRGLLAGHGRPRPMVVVTLSCPLAMLLALDERWDDAHAHLAQARQLATDLGYTEGAAVVPIFAATVEALAGRPLEAVRLLDDAAEAAARSGAGGLHNGIARDAARSLLELGRPEAAAGRLAAPGTPVRLLRSDRADLDGIHGRILASQGAFDQAVRLADRAVATAEQTDSPIVRAVAALDLAHVLQAAGRPVRAAVAARSARQHFADKGHRPGLRRVARLQAALSTEPTDRTRR